MWEIIFLNNTHLPFFVVSFLYSLIEPFVWTSYDYNDSWHDDHGDDNGYVGDHFDRHFYFSHYAFEIAVPIQFQSLVNTF